MLESLREALRQAIENFQSEVNRDRIPEAADRLLRAMQSELIDLKREAERLEEEIERTREEAGREEEAAKTCARREEMAQKIGDGETASVANEFALKHLRRHEILSQKVEVLTVELQDRRRGLDEMTVQFREARLRRESLAATAGRTDTRETMRRADELFHEMDRMADRIRDLESRGAASEEIDEMFAEEPSGEQPMEPDLDARLEALKRKMNEG